MSDEEIMSLLRAIKEQLNTMETRQVMMDERTLEEAKSKAQASMDQ